MNAGARKIAFTGHEARPGLRDILNQWIKRPRILHGDDDPDAVALDVAKALVRSGNVQMMLGVASADELAKALRPLVRDSMRRQGAV